MLNSSNNFELDQDYTYKHFYYPASDDESEKQQSHKRKHISRDINAFFDITPENKKKKTCSTVGQPHASGGVSYISTNKEDAANATHLMKIEIFDLRKLDKVSDEREHWKHADVRVKYYVDNKDENNHYLQAKSEKQQSHKRKHISRDINAFFDITPENKKKKTCSTVGQPHASGGVSYISTNKEDAANATHLMKIEIFDLRKLDKVSDEREHWKHADVRVKYYVDNKDENNHYLQAKEVIYKITKEISETKDCVKYHFGS